MAIEQVKLENFQAHEHRVVDLSPGVTTVVGPSDAGKSAILRALWWALTNQPGGDAFIRDGAKLAQVWVVLDGGRTIHRLRGAFRNEYTLDGSEKYVSFGAGVPDAVAQLANVGPVCFQSQHDAPFWFSETAGQVSRNLNAIVDLGVIDEALGAVAGRLQRAKYRVEDYEAQLSKAVQARNELGWVLRAEALLAVCQERDKLAKRAVADRFRVEVATQAAQAAAQQMETSGTIATGALAVLRAMSAAGQQGQQVARLAQAVQQAAQAAQAAQRSVPDLSQVSEALAAYEAHHRAVQGLQGHVARVRTAEENCHYPVPDTTAIDAAYEALHAHRVERGALRLAMDAVLAARENVVWYKRQAEAAHKELETKSEGVCPLCGNHVQT